MKKFIILGYLYGIGGWQTYTANKLKLMQDNGWDIFAINNGMQEMLGESLPFMKQVRKINLPQLGFTYPSEFSVKQIKCVCEKVKSIADICDDDEIIFEATVLNLFLWAEVFAKRFNGRSICAEVSNRFSKYPSATLDFFHFKSQRGELMMMSETGKHELFEGYLDYPKLDTKTVGALTQSEFADDGKDYISILNTAEADYIIGTVGWLDKGYYKILIDEVIKFCNQNQEKKIQFIVVGKSLTGEIEADYEKKAAKIPNLKLNMMGIIAPVPSNLVRLFNVSVSSYGCAIITDKLGVKTISMHDPENIPLGVLSYTIIREPYNTRVNFEKTISEMLTDILINGVYDSMPRVPFPINDVEKQKEIHLKRIHDLPEKIEYYDVLSLKNENASIKHKLMVMIQKVFGYEFADSLSRRLKR